MKQVTADEWADFASDFGGFMRENKKDSRDCMEQVCNGGVVSRVVYHQDGSKEYWINEEARDAARG